MFKKHLYPLAAIGCILLQLSGCSYFLSLHQPVTPQEEMIADIWPILNKIQRKEIKQLQSVEEIQLFMDRFWEEIDPTPNTKFNEFKVEYEARVDYVHIHYKYKRGWMHSDRGRVYLIYGPPDDITYRPWILNATPKGPNFNSLEIWVYDILVLTDDFPTIFDHIDPNLMKFCFADFSAVGRYTQIYSNIPGEKIYPDVYQFLMERKFAGYPLKLNFFIEP